MMNEHIVLVESVSFCGLICRLCFMADKCDGCKTDINLCEKNCSDEGCFNKSCCETKGIKGCCECSEIYSCNQGIFSLGDMSKIKAFSICIRDSPLRSTAHRVAPSAKYFTLVNAIASPSVRSGTHVLAIDDQLRNEEILRGS